MVKWWKQVNEPEDGTGLRYGSRMFGTVWVTKTVFSVLPGVQQLLPSNKQTNPDHLPHLHDHLKVHRH